jgi:AcrR family transcriptional regulator
MTTDMKSTRSYTMTARAEATEQTRRRILRACVDEHLQRPVAEIALADIAARAGVSVQTVLRHFGSRAGLVEEALGFAQAAVVEQRRAPVGDPEAALRILVEHYESEGESVLLMLAQEQSEPLMARITTAGKRLHREWVAEVFAPYLSRGGDGEQLLDLLVVATDVYAWKLLRRDRRLTRSQTEERMTALVRAVLAQHAPDGQSEKES